MTKEELVDLVIETNFSQLHYFQKILLKQMLMFDGKETRQYSTDGNVPIGGLKTTSKHYDELYGRKEQVKDEKDE